MAISRSFRVSRTAAGVALIVGLLGWTAAVFLLVTDGRLNIDLGARGWGRVTAARFGFGLALSVFAVGLWNTWRQRRFDAVKVATDLLQGPDARANRALAYSLEDVREAKGIGSTVVKAEDKEVKEATDGADDTAQRMNTLAFLMQRHLISRRLVYANWGVSIARSWEKTEPHIQRRRATLGDDSELFTPFANIGRDALDRYGHRTVSEERPEDGDAIAATATSVP